MNVCITCWFVAISGIHALDSGICSSGCREECLPQQDLILSEGVPGESGVSFIQRLLYARH